MCQFGLMQRSNGRGTMEAYQRTVGKTMFLLEKPDGTLS
jgi:hypothetical protein